MTTRRTSTRNLQQLAAQAQANEQNEDQVRDYDLNYGKTLQRKAKACNVSYLVTGEEKGGNQVFSFSTAMYELYKCKLLEHFNAINDNPNSSVKAIFTDVTEKSGMVVESQIKVYQRTQNGSGRPKYTVNLYHTNNRIMVNGRHAMQFNAEHNYIADLIVSSEQVASMDQSISSQIQEGLSEIVVSKMGKRINSGVSQQRAGSVRTSPKQALQRGGNVSGASALGSSESESKDPEILCCPTCDQDIESKHSICCDHCEVWFHAECEFVDNGTYERLTAADVGYMCLTCSHEEQTCENLNESIIMEERNKYEASPDPESTHRKEGYEPESDVHTVSRIPGDNNPKCRNEELTSHNQWIDIGDADKQMGRTVNDVHLQMCVSVDRASEITPDLQELRTIKDGGRSKALNSSIHLDTTANPEVLIGDKNSLVVNSESNQSKPQRKGGGRQKVKETEQGEQLKLALSLINNLERKLGEVQNSNKILRQELNLIKL